jgi:hypothetical protein
MEMLKRNVFLANSAFIIHLKFNSKMEGNRRRGTVGVYGHAHHGLISNL